MCKCVSRNTTNSSETKDTGYKANLTTDIIFCDHNKLMESGTSQYLKSTSNSYPKSSLPFSHFAEVVDNPSMKVMFSSSYTNTHAQPSAVNSSYFLPLSNFDFVSIEMAGNNLASLAPDFFEHQGM
ncbi:hypothetical protein EB796_017146 [Bugula neritina]|uniref:Uncharacterized protein n=1 Tax=Bugula neritina TaxID=10212 RepID=A0A7J7JG28_BUGNE|nr:hypothetical protein EB796_017146 [Bugula neritina]